MAASPYLFFGVMLGASLWYVARRLYGNAGGYIALALYCFSPAMIVNVAGVQNAGEMGAAKVSFRNRVYGHCRRAHALCSAEVVLWNWRRILLLGLSARACDRQASFSWLPLALVILPLCFGLRRFEARRGHDLGHSGAGCMYRCFPLTSLTLHCSISGKDCGTPDGSTWNPRLLACFVSYRGVLQTIFASSPPLMIALPVALVTYLAAETGALHRKCSAASDAGTISRRGFGRAQFSRARLSSDHACVFLVFISGVFADLLETQHSSFVMAAAIAGLLSASAIWNLLQLWRA